MGVAVAPLHFKVAWPSSALGLPERFVSDSSKIMNSFNYIDNAVTGWTAPYVGIPPEISLHCYNGSIRLEERFILFFCTFDHFEEHVLFVVVDDLNCIVDTFRKKKNFCIITFVCT